MPGTPVVVAVVPCKDEAQRVAATVTALRALPRVSRVVVVDDGSSDRTSEVAQAAGAVVAHHPRNRGKAAALVTGVRRARQDGPVDVLLFADGDLQETAAELGVLLDPVLADEADLAIATLPPQKVAGGGHGFVVRLAREGIERLTGFRALQPLSGMRALTSAAYDAATPLARGWGVEVGMTVDVLRAGLRVTEVPCALEHRVTGADWRGQLHRAAQYRDVWFALTRRRLAR